MLLFFSNVSNFTQNVLTFCSWPKFDEGCWNYHMILVHSRQCLFCHQGQKRMAKQFQTILPFWLLFCRWFGYYFALVWKIDTTSLTCECSCMLCPNFENFCPNNGQFFSVGDATASPASPCRTLMHVPLQNFIMWTWTSKISHENKADEESNKNIFINRSI